MTRRLILRVLGAAATLSLAATIPLATASAAPPTVAAIEHSAQGDMVRPQASTLPQLKNSTTWTAQGRRAADGELALSFEEGHLLLPQWVSAAWLPVERPPHFAVVDAALSDMSGVEHAHLWTVEAPRDAPEWASDRELAARALPSNDHSSTR